jgi:hypothetical protein
MDEVPTNRRLSSLNSLEDNPLIESAIYFLASTADAEGAGTPASCGKYKF